MSESTSTTHVTSIDTQIGGRVHTMMWRRRITRRALADAIGMNETVLSRKLRGERRWYAVEVAAVAESLQVPVGYLYSDGPDGAPSGTRTPNPLVKSLQRRVDVSSGLRRHAGRSVIRRVAA